MSVDTYGITENLVSVEEIFNFIRSKFDVTATMHLYLKEYLQQTGLINFKYMDKNKSMFVIAGNINEHKDIITGERYTWLDLGKEEYSVEIMKAIINQFGGWVDEVDCDEEDYYHIPANPDKEVPPIIRVTMQDIYDKFGGIVVITK